jgi:hypothetical protein
MRSICTAAPTTLLLFAIAGTAAAQGGIQPDLNELALDWARGRYASPLLCEIGGRSLRGLRRLLIAPGPRDARPPVARIVFVDLEPGEATRCFTDLGESAPNVTGSLQIRLPGHSRRDTATRDFATALRRKGGFEFDVSDGQLRITEIGKEADGEHRVDFQGGHARLYPVAKGSDDARLLSEFKSPRKLSLELDAPDGTRLRLPVFMTDQR